MQVQEKWYRRSVTRSWDNSQRSLSSKILPTGESKARRAARLFRQHFHGSARLWELGTHTSHAHTCPSLVDKMDHKWLEKWVFKQTLSS